MKPSKLPKPKVFKPTPEQQEQMKRLAREHGIDVTLPGMRLEKSESVSLPRDWTHVGDLALPRELTALLRAGRWPRTHEEARRQNLSDGAVPLARVRRFAPDEDTIAFSPPPFLSIAERARGAEAEGWRDFGALHEIAPELSVSLGDFGLGSDTVFALDYRANRDNPPVIRLQYLPQQTRPMHWIVAAPTFAHMAAMLEL